MTPSEILEMLTLEWYPRLRLKFPQACIPPGLFWQWWLHNALLLGPVSSRQASKNEIARRKQQVRAYGALPMEDVYPVEPWLFDEFRVHIVQHNT